MSTEASIPIRIAQTLGITSSLMLGGLSLGFSTFTVPRLMESPTPLMLRQFQKMYFYLFVLDFSLPVTLAIHLYP